MIDNTSASVKLTKADQEKLKLVENRLTVLQGEVLAATKNLASLEEAIVQAATDKKFYDELIEGLKPQVDSLNKRKAGLEKDIQQSETTLSSHAAEHQKMTDYYDGRKADHDTRDSELTVRESEHRTASEAVSQEKLALEKEKQELAKVRAAFIEAAQLMA